MRKKAVEGSYWNKRCAGHKISMAAAGQKKVSNPLDVDNSAAVVTIAVRADTRRACSEEKVSFHERTAKTLTQESPSMASVPSKDFFRFFPILFLPYRFPTSAAAASPGPQANWPPGEDAGKGEVPVPEPAPANAYCQHEHKVGRTQALVQFSGTSFR